MDNKAVYFFGGEGGIEVLQKKIPIRSPFDTFDLKNTWVS